MLDVKQKIKEITEDRVIVYPDLRNTGQPVRDRLFNWVVSRYKRFNHPWKQSDERVWGGFIYTVLDYVWMLVWIGLLWFIINGSLRRVGFEKTVFVVAVIFLIRLNALVKQLVKLNKKF